MMSVGFKALDYMGSVMLATYCCCGAAAKIKGGKYALQPRDSGDARHGLIRNFKGWGPKHQPLIFSRT